MAIQINPQLKQRSHLLACAVYVLENRSCKLVNISAMCRWYSCHFLKVHIKGRRISARVRNIALTETLLCNLAIR